MRFEQRAAFAVLVVFCLVAVSGSVLAVVESADFPEGDKQIAAGIITLDISASDGCTDLIAGQHEDVGEVCWEFMGVGGDLQMKITYQTVHPWCLSETHLHVAEDASDIPQTRKGNPKIGKFDHSADVVPCDTSWMVTVDVPDDCTQLVVAAHAVVQSTEVDLGAVEDALTDELTGLPDTAQISVSFPGGDSYFNTTVINSLDPGPHDGWCVDTSRTITPGATYTAELYSSYDDLTGIVDHPENMDKVNCLINQGLVGQPSPGCSGNYTYGDVQRAIWSLIDDNQSTAGLGSWSQCRADELVALAESAICQDFVPSCNEKIAVVLRPVSSTQVTVAQVTIIELGLPEACIIIGEETAWGFGNSFPGNSWAMYFDVGCP